MLSIPFSTLLMTIFAAIATGLAIYVVYLRKSEQLLNKVYKDLQQQSSQRNDRLYNINNQLYEEISKHELTKARLTETRNYLQSIVNSMPSILIGIDRNGIVTHWNTAANNKTGTPYHQALGQHFQSVINEPIISMKLITTAIDQQKPQKLEAIQEGHGSNARFRDITIYPLVTTDAENAVIRIDDVSSRIQLENMIIQNEKMGSLGELAAGVAHEVNNPLGTILQSLQNIHRRLSTTLSANNETAKRLSIDLHTINQYLEERKILLFLSNIQEAGERAASIVTNMLEFSRSNSFQHKPIQLIELLNRSIDLAISASSVSQKYENITFTIVRDFPDTCPLVYGSAAELQQVILNLINNAYQAYSDAYLQTSINEEITKPGELDITISLTTDKQHAIITVSDNGPGMDDWTQKHIFEPFFTTKEAGSGTGLGLSVSYFIITEHHQGSIGVESAMGNGTTFTIKLPLNR